MNKMINNWCCYRTMNWLVLAMFLTACANLPIQPLAPQISLTDFKVANLGVFEQNYVLQLRLKNPNPFPMPLTNLDYVLYINDQEFTKGMSKQPLTLPALGENSLELKVTSNLWRIVEQWRNWEVGFTRQFNYRLTGGVNMLNGVPKIPFEYKGEVMLTWGGKN